MRRCVLLFFLTLITTFVVGGQTLIDCGTVATDEDVSLLSSFAASKSQRVATQPSSPVYIAVTAHVVRLSSGQGGLSSSELAAAVARLNEDYAMSGLQFYIHGEIHYIDNDSYYDFDSSKEAEITTQNNVPSTINIYFFNSLSSGASQLCGYAYFPSANFDHIMMANGCTTSGRTLAHEIGHYFALYHTHGKTNTGTTDELVNGSNCLTAGDDICDTPADPNLSQMVDSGTCGYIGNLSDSNGDVFQPDARNIMSYSTSACRLIFSDQQMSRMYEAYQVFKSYLITRSYVPQFAMSDSFGCVDDLFSFVNTSIGFDTFQWTFEDGSPATSSNETAEVSFSSAGYKDVTLFLYTEEGESIILKDSVLIRPADPDVLDFYEGGFESGNRNYVIYNPDGDQSFRVTNSSKLNGSSSLLIEFFKTQNRNTFDYVFLPSVNSSEVKTFSLSFHYAYSQVNSWSNDGLQVLLKNSCGDWEELWGLFGEQLSTASPRASYFVPSSSDWRRIDYNFEVPSDMTNVELCFRATSDSGNNLYLDDYALYPDDPLVNISGYERVNPTCPDSMDGSIELLVGSCSGCLFSIDNINYSESNLFQNLPTGTFRLYVKRSDTQIAEFVTVQLFADNNYPTKPLLTYSSSGLRVTANILPGQFLTWYFNNEVLSQSSTLLTDLEAGTYMVSLSNGFCERFSEPFIVTSSSLFDTKNLREGIYPNPSTGSFRIQVDSDSARLEFVDLYRLDGTLIARLAPSEDGLFSVPSYTLNGVYLIVSDASISRLVLSR